MDSTQTGNKAFNLEELNKTMPGSTKKSSKILFILGGIILLVIYSTLLFSGGVFLGSNSKKTASVRVNQLTRLSDPADPMFANLQGSINGQIVSIVGNKAYFKSNKGGTGVFNISSPVLVSEILGGKVVDLGNAPDKIKLNEEATIKITGFGNGFAIYSVTYLKDTTTLTLPANPLENPKTASQTAKSKR